jgi:hypothetical protein
MRPPQSDPGRDAWLRILPAVAARVYVNIWFLHSQTGSPPLGDLDDPDAAWWVDLIAPTGLDEPYDPARDPTLERDRDEEQKELKLWRELQGYARERGLPMTTSRHVVDFMLDLNLVERRETEIGITWTIVSPLPNVEDVLTLSPERQESESITRWRIGFSQIAETIAGWIRGLKTPGAETQEFTTSIRTLAEELCLDLEDARHGLTVLLNDDIRCNVDPETAAIDTPLRLNVDWKLFEEWRTPYGATSRAEEELGGREQDDP